MVKTWCIDGTLKVVKKPFYQLLSIHGFVRSGDDLKQIPQCFCIMSGKKKRHYKKVFQSIKDLLPETKVKSFVVDFEKGLWQGLRAAFGISQIRGCAFHVGERFRNWDYSFSGSIRNTTVGIHCCERFSRSPYYQLTTYRRHLQSYKEELIQMQGMCSHPYDMWKTTGFKTTYGLLNPGQFMGEASEPIMV